MRINLKKTLQIAYFLYLSDLLRFVVPWYCVYTSMPSFSRVPVLTEAKIVNSDHFTLPSKHFWLVFVLLLLLLLLLLFIVTILGKKKSQEQIELNSNNQ